MLDISNLLAAIERPKLLVRTARFAVDDYRRDRDLTRLLRVSAPPRPAEAVIRLVEAEAEMEARRRENRADYSFAAHVDVMIALMGEARVYRAATH